MALEGNKAEAKVRFVREGEKRDTENVYREQGKGVMFVIKFYIP